MYDFFYSIRAVNPVKKHFRRLMTDIVTKLWGFCHTLRHDGIDYGDYIEQLTYLLVLKIVDEKETENPLKNPI